MKRFPDQLEALLTPHGRALLKQKPSLLQHFRSETGLISARTSAAAVRLLERALGDVLTPMEDPIPDWTVSAMRENYAELLPKTVRVRTALLESRRAKAFVRAQDIGLVAMLRSDSFRALAQVLSGRALAKGQGIQALCYGPGDYTGPHNDHHPEEPDAKHGYVDCHLTFCNGGVKEQLLVSAKDGHFTEVVSVATRGGVTCYRLPFWHFTTPLQGTASARRWVLLGTFLDAAVS